MERGRNETVYRVDLGDAFLSDSLLAQSRAECQRVAREAAADGDPLKAAEIKSVAVQMGFGGDKDSYVHLVTRGEISTSTLSGFTVGGRRLNAYEVAGNLAMTRIYAYGVGFEENDAVVEGLILPTWRACRARRSRRLTRVSAGARRLSGCSASQLRLQWPRSCSRWVCRRRWEGRRTGARCCRLRHNRGVEDADGWIRLLVGAGQD